MFLKDRLFRIATATTLAVLVVFFGGLLLSMAGSTTPGRFASLLSSKEILFAIKLSVVTATLATLAAVLVALPAAYTLSRYDFPGKNLVDTFLDLPIVLSPIALGAALLIFSGTRAGTFVEKNLFAFVFEVPGLILAQFTVVVALATRLLKSTFDMIDPRYVSVGRVLGCTAFQAFRKVALPLAKPGIVAAIILTWARAIGEFGASVTLAGATAMKTETLPIAIYLSFATADVEKAVAVIFVLIAIAGAALLSLRWIGGRSIVR
ncbi:MAG: ABC transporter permease subunit [Phycisphaerales bacterium]|jgi:molybdate transport system permease protein